MYLFGRLESPGEMVIKDFYTGDLTLHGKLDNQNSLSYVECQVNFLSVTDGTAQYMLKKPNNELMFSQKQNKWTYQ